MFCHIGYARRFSLSRFVFGLGLILLGVFFTLDNVHAIHGHQYYKYWPVLLIAYGAARLIDPRRATGRFFGLVVFVAGVLFLLRNTGTIGWNVWDLWPLLLALIGLSVISQAIFGHGFSRRHSHRVKFRIDDETGPGAVAAVASSGETSDSVVDIHTSFGETKRIISTPDFRGGSVNVSMGSCVLDLRQASIAAERAVLDMHVVMGGVEIRVPETWRVVMRTNAFLGGVEDSTHKPAGDAKELVITGDTVFAGIEVKN